jgi:hypothetical protein
MDRPSGEFVISGVVQAFLVIQDRDGTRVVELREREDARVGLARVAYRGTSVDVNAPAFVNGDPVAVTRRLVSGDVIESSSVCAIFGTTRSRQPLAAVDAGSEHTEVPEPRTTDMRAQLGEVERAAIVAALEASGGNQTHAATFLGISRRTLIYRLEKHGLKPIPSHRFA